MTSSKSIPARIFQHVQARPEQTSIFFRNLDIPGVGGEVSLTYGELWAQASGLSACLDFLEVGEHAIIVMPICPQLLVAHLAILLRGAIASIFTHPSEKIASDVYAQKLRHAVSVFHPRAIITTDTFLEEVRRSTEGEKVEIVLFPDSVPGNNFSDNRWKIASPSSNAIIQYSSGSTGLQKAIALTHEMVIGQCDSYARAINLTPKGDRICGWLPLYHDMGLFTSWLMPVLQGVPTFFIDPFQWVKQPQSLLKLITDVEGTLCWQPNFAFNLLSQRVSGDMLEGLDLSSLRGIVNCSEPVSALSLENFQKSFSKIGVRPSAMWSCYAMAENSFAVSSATEGAALSGTIRINSAALGQGIVEIGGDGNGVSVTSCGRVIEGTEVSIVDADNGSPISGRVGEILLKSSYMLKEYYRHPEITATAIDLDGWYHTGDLGFSHDGNVYITGRKKDLLIVGGRNFYPHDIEAICERFEGCISGRSVALGVNDEKLGTQKVTLILESRLTDDAAKSQLAAQIRKAVFDELDCPLADVRIVSHMWLLKTSSGKIARQPNLGKYLAEFLSRDSPQLTFVAVGLSPISWLSMVCWSLGISIAIYTITMITSLGTNQSWNIYMRF